MRAISLKTLFRLITFFGIVTTLFICLKGPAKTMDVKEWFPLFRRTNDMHQTKMLQDKNINIQTVRKDYVHKYCRAAKVPKPKTNASVNILYNEKFKLSSVIVPKIGSSFLTQMFAVLKNGPLYAKYNLTAPRNKVKYTYPNRKLLLNNLISEKTVTIVPARNPFSRLYSAFVDKVYLPHGIKLGLEIISHKIRRNFEGLKQSSLYDSSGLSITFQDFLNYALDPLVKVKIQQNHYGPCFPTLKVLLCNLNEYYIVKLETFEADMKYVLQSVDIDHKVPETYNAIVRSLYESHIEDSIPGIIKDAFYRAQTTEGDHKVWTGRIIAERLWHSFQLQGYISEFLPFPTKYFNSEWNYSNVSFIVETFLHEMKKVQLSRIDSMTQRQEAMSLAYKGVSEEVIRKIQDVYSCDFQSFGYDVTLE